MPLEKQVKIDPIRKRYYRPLDLVEMWAGGLFYVVAALSFAALALDRQEYPRTYDSLHILFIVGVIFHFIVGIFIRLYLTPRAEDKRRQELISNSFGASLLHERTIGYYNNKQKLPFLRLGASVLENSFFSKSISLEMAKNMRFKMMTYSIIWIFVALNRSSDLSLIAAAAQVLFSEELFAGWIRTEWSRTRFEGIYDELYQLMHNRRGNLERKIRANILYIVLKYEAGKAYGGVNLSTGIFEKMNSSLTEEWNRISLTLNL